ncbi:MAG TPA: type III secretion system cytoplasmic ring protein SctQ [Bryobacteraceae bacterium]|jgi:flagellar motor switch/type III secretory pathway protein FliN|nr:type III secretion system cytoplasmic ring protein SctQ [Bryobacteraceae bacterium]
MSLLGSAAALGVFDGLKSYSRTVVELINRFADVFRTDADWGLWLQEGLAALLDAPGERFIVLQQKNQIESGDSLTLSFRKESISIGREPDNDIVVSVAGVGRHHARIVSQERRYFLEDLGSANGTYLNDVKLEPHKPVLLKEGAQFLIFPHQFSFSSQQVWQRQDAIRVAGGAPRVITSTERWSHEFGGARLFTIRISPDVGSAGLRVSADLLKSLLYRISQAEPEHIFPADNGLFEFLLLSLLERANRELKFPFHFSLVPFEAPPKDEPGVSIEYVLDLTGAAGVIEVFLPGRLLKEIHRVRGGGQFPDISVSWHIFATVGYSDLSLQELADLEMGDVLLVSSAHRLLLPATPQAGDRGWEAALVQSEPRRLRIEQYFERSNLTMESDAAIPKQEDFQKPDLTTLPVRVHIVLSQLEMSLAELNKLRPGSIVELDREKCESVQLAVNGKIAGAGELVEIEGRLGVRISNWNTQ